MTPTRFGNKPFTPHLKYFIIAFALFIAGVIIYGYI